MSIHDISNGRVNPSDKTGGANNIARKRGHADLDLTLAVHPYRKDIMPLKDDRAIRNALKNLLLTDSFERPFQPNLGANLRGLLFEPMGILTELSITDQVKLILRSESRVEILKVNVKGNENKNRYDITIKFKIKENNQIDTFNVSLRRLR